jgi:hypothetical protein
MGDIVTSLAQLIALANENTRTHIPLLVQADAV